uniref:Uncharacterized protein n=1 Tax=Oryza rufipogon TaxID=4529 RepID=A0A0E0Q4M0_ORYRU
MIPEGWRGDLSCMGRGCQSCEAVLAKHV